MLTLVTGLFLVQGLLRLQLYGQWYPNSVYVKTGHGLAHAIKSGLLYLLDVMSLDLRRRRLGGVLYVLALAGASAPWLGSWWRALRHPDREALSRAAPAGLLALAVVGFTVAVGGDWMPRGRFLVPVAVLGGVTLTSLAPAAGSRQGIAAIAVALALATVFVTHPLARRSDLLGLIVQCDTTCQRPIAQYLQSHGRPGERLAAADIGQVGYTFPGDVVDFCGLANPPLAHAGRSTSTALPEDILRGNPRWVLAYAAGPVTDATWPTEGGFAAPSMERLSHVPGIRARYAVVMQCRAMPHRWHVLLERRTP